MASSSNSAQRHPERGELRLPMALIIMDGFGLDEPTEGNAIAQANTPVLDGLFETCPWVTLEASGEAVGLPAGQMGNSEVGHLNIGAGRVVYQELTRINKACVDGSIITNEKIQESFEWAKKPGAALHLMGLLSDGGVHSNNVHLYALIRGAIEAGVKDVRVHCFMDGRDVPPRSGARYVQELLDVIGEIKAKSPEAVNISIASLSGRYYAMDRDNRWERVQKAYETIVEGANYQDVSAVSAMESSYTQDITDEFIVPVAFSDRGMKDGDAVIFFNFRPDRAREITRAITAQSFDGFDRKKVPHVYFVCLTEYDPELNASIAFEKEFPENVLADVIAQEGLSQYHIAETEKYAHVTFFLNGGREEAKEGESRTLIPSPKVATYDLQPEMSEPEVAATLSEAIKEDAADFYIVNFANCDMVGHTGILEAAIRAVEAVDSGVGLVLDAVKEKGGVAFVTADHGNADKMIADDGSPHTAHTTALVPFILADYSGDGLKLSGEAGRLADIAPTMLAAAKIPAPQEMEGKSLLA